MWFILGIFFGIFLSLAYGFFFDNEKVIDSLIERYQKRKGK